MHRSPVAVGSWRLAALGRLGEVGQLDRSIDISGDHSCSLIGGPSASIKGCRCGDCYRTDGGLLPNGRRMYGANSLSVSVQAGVFDDLSAAVKTSRRQWSTRMPTGSSGSSAMNFDYTYVSAR